MKPWIIFWVACIVFALQIQASERELLSEQIINIKLAPNPIVCRNAVTIGRGFVAYFPADISIGSHLIENGSPMLDGIAQFTFELPSSVACENLQFSEMPRNTSITRRVYRQNYRGDFHPELVKSIFFVETTLAIPVQMDGRDIVLTGTMKPWISHAQKNGQPYEDYVSRIHPQAHTISCKSYGLENERYVLAIPGVRRYGGDEMSNINELEHIFSNQAECQEFYSQLLSHYHSEDPGNYGSLVTVSRRLEEVPIFDPSFGDICYLVEQETSSIMLLGLEFSGVKTSFPIKPCTR